MLILHHLNDSRSQRILWLLEELGTPYEMHPNLSAWLGRMHARPALRRSIENGGAYRFG
jgi:glutathione S-transferase